MSTDKINIKTIYPVHIGDGISLRYGSDFILADAHDFKDEKGGGKSLYIIDPKKIWDIVGKNRLDRWTAAIDSGVDTLQFVQGIDKSKQAKDIALREIPCDASKVVKTDTLKTCIHDGLGRPYIPGSSLKGAIRTAVLASLVPKNKKIYNAQRVEEDLFGEGPNNDLFRFLQVGDAYFEAGSETSFRMVQLKKIWDNKKTLRALMDKSNSQLIEAIEQNQETDFSIKIPKIPDNLLNRFKQRFKDEKENFLNISNLFKIINDHTSKLLDKEIKFWEDIKDNEGAYIYLKCLKFIKKYIKTCKEGRECVIRVGHASGWRFITGAWAEELEDSNKKNPPKTRRIVENSDVLGFVKLSINNKNNN